MFDFGTYAMEQGLDLAPAGHKHTRPGWVQVECPFCTGNPGYHLGFNEGGGFFNCWRCGWHGNIEVVKFFSGVGWNQAKEILRDYETGVGPSADSRRHIAISPLTLPKGTTDLDARHKAYLENRGFNPADVINTWHLRATGHIGPYKHRIIAPIYHNNYLVSYQGRDWTEKSELRYKACEQNLEVMPHQNTLYGLDIATFDKVILVEGITDAWRMGRGSVACFGIDITRMQKMLLIERFNEVYVMFDDDPQAIEKADDLCNELAMMGIYTELLLIMGDPGGLKQKKANRYKKEILGDIY